MAKMPIATKTYRYVPILRWKTNERTALKNLSAQGRSDVTPLIVVSQGQYKGSRSPKKPTKKAPVSAADNCSKQLADSWGKDEVFIDASDLLVSPSRHQFDDIAASLRAQGVSFIPTTRLTAPTEYQAAVNRAAAADHRGIALRITLSEMASAASWARSLRNPISETDLIIDLEGSVASVAALGVAVAPTFGALYRGSHWRSVTIAGGCIPATLSAQPHGLSQLPRDELRLWQMLDGQGLPFKLDFGDYGSVSPDASALPIPGPTPINAKYSLRDRFLVFRGVKTKGPGARTMETQLRGYATQIVGFRGRGPLAHCWGDGQIDQIAAGTTATGGSPGSWIGLNINRHIEVTRLTLP